jgi:hypothetical protein
VKLFRNSFELDEATESRDYHAFFTLKATRERGPVTLLVLPFQVIPDLAIGALAVPAKIAVRDGVDRQVLETTQQPILLRYADFLANYFKAYQLLVRIEQIRTLFTHRQRQYNRSLLKFVTDQCGGY